MNTPSRSLTTLTLLTSLALASTLFVSAAHAQSAESAESSLEAEPDTFEGDTPLELTVGVGNGGSLGVGFVLAPEASISLLGVGHVSTSESFTFLHGTLGASLDLAFLRPRVGEIVPVAQLYGGVSGGSAVGGSSVGLLGQSPLAGQAYVGGGLMYELDRHLALRGVVGPSMVFNDAMVSASIFGHVALVYRP